MGQPFFSVILFLLAPVSAAADIMASHRLLHQRDHETMLVEAIEKVREDNIQGAINTLSHLTRDKPEFRLAQLIYADLLLARTRPIPAFGALPSAPREHIAPLRDEARARWAHYLRPPPANRVPASLVQLDADQRHAIVVDMRAHRLLLFESRGGVPYLIRDFYATIGKQGVGKLKQGDKKTPIGVYFVSGFISSDELPDRYGSGAFTLDYPNAWDQRQGRTGYGIWLHGTSASTFSRPPRDSDGCVIVSNDDLNEIAPYMQAKGTPVILTASINWLSRQAWLSRQSDFAKLIERWPQDRESHDADLYRSHYSPTYSGPAADHQAQATHKPHPSPDRRFIRGDSSNRGMFLYPGEPGLLLVTFGQDDGGDEVGEPLLKRQYWQREKDGRWRIVYEGGAS